MSSREAEALQQRIIEFVRVFGLHRPDETPCGAPVPVSEAHALGVLADAGPLSQNELAKRLHLTKSTVSRLIDQLTRRGWVERRPGEHDGRQRLVELTTAGQKSARQMASRRAERMQHVLDRIPDSQRAAVLAALDALVDAAHED